MAPANVKNVTHCQQNPLHIMGMGHKIERDSDLKSPHFPVPPCFAAKWRMELQRL